MDFHLQFASSLVKAVVLLAGLAMMLRVRPRPAPVGLIAAAAGVLLVGLLYRLFPVLGFDYRIFWEVGRDVWAGRDPYAGEHFADHPFLNPPTALPVFALFAVLPFDVSFVVWTVLNVLACLALVAWAQHILWAQEGVGESNARGGPVSGTLPPLALVVLTAAIAVSDASVLTLILGQVSILAAVFLLAALAAQSRGRPVWAGVCLALATIKVTTMLPFLLLFLRKPDRWTWVSLPAATLGLCLLTGPAAGLPGRLATVGERIEQLEAPGMVNDYSFGGPQHLNMVGFEHAFYCLGLRDRQVIHIAQYLALLGLGTWVAWQVVGGRLPRAAACSLVALFAVVFLYHRAYDAVLLALPLVYSVGRARTASGRARLLFAACAVAVLLALYPHLDLLSLLYRSSLRWGAWGWLVQALVLPYVTWAILLAMICLVRAARTAPPGSGAGQARQGGADLAGALGEERAMPAGCGQQS